MGYRFEQPGFCVSVEGAFVFPRLWLIHATIAYRKGLGIEARESLSREADLEVMRGVSHEVHRAWTQGATRVRVLIDGDGNLDRFFEVLKEEPTPASAA